MNLSHRALAMLVLACLALGGLLGSVATDYLNGRSAVVQVAAEETRTAPNDVIPETQPGGKPKLPAPTKPHGADPTSTLELTAKPAPVDLPARRVGDVLCPAERIECPPLDLRIDFFELDGQLRVAARSSDGSELAGRFLPPVMTPGVRDERITVVGNPGGDVIVTYQRDFGRWSAAASGWQIDDKPGAGAGGSFSW